MIITGLHFLWSYRCTYECDHCFAWGSPTQEGTFTLEQLDRIFEQAEDLGTIEWIYFEGGEPFLYYATLLRGVQRSKRTGYKCGVVTNAYWATNENDAIETLGPFAGLIDDLSISADLYHSDDVMNAQIRSALNAAEKLGIPAETISIEQPETEARASKGTLLPGAYNVMYRGRAADKLTGGVKRRPWDSFTDCPHENLRDPGRVHIDPFGNVHLCQGLCIGNVFEKPLKEIFETYDPDAHAVIGPLLAGGPAELIRRYKLPHEDGYADACHICYEARRALRDRFPAILAPDQMYGMTGDEGAGPEK